MPDVVRYGLVVMVVFLTHFQEGITGFGCSVLALPFVTLLVGLRTAVPVLVILAWWLALLIVVESRRHIVWREYLRIVGWVVFGLPWGVWAFRSLPETGLKWVLALFMVGVGVHGLVRQGQAPAGNPGLSPSKRRLLSLALPIGGVIHGAFGTGGPLVVIYAAQALPEKTLFRVTLCLLWFTLNTVMIAQLGQAGRLTPEVWRLVLLCLPANLAGMWLGNRAHYRINERVFRRLVYGVLMLSGVILIASLL